ncbi:MAG TPA: O-antigen ligase family protein [Paludibacter sp.]|nr:O-antigen ligase family protein [Paludibacter sp.]
MRLTNLFSVLFLITQLACYINLFQRIAFVAALISYTLEVFLEKKWKNFKWENSTRQWFFIVAIFFFLLQFIFWPLEKNTDTFVKILEERIPFLAFGIVGLLGFNQYFRLKYVAYAFIGTSVVLGVFLLSNLNAEILHSEFRNELLGLIRVKYINSHMKFNYYLNISLICIYYLFRLLKNKKAFWANLALALSALVIILNLFLSDGRIGFVSGLIILTVFIFRYFWHKSKPLTFISTAVFILLAIITISINPRFSKSSIKHEPRQEIWGVAVDEIKKSNFLGVGACTAAYDMQNEFAARGMVNNKHTHNIFLQSTLEYGVIGFATILCMFTLCCFTTSNKFRIMILLVTETTFLQLFVGSFERDLNPMVFLLFVILVVQQDKLDGKKASIMTAH